MLPRSARWILFGWLKQFSWWKLIIELRRGFWLVLPEWSFVCAGPGKYLSRGPCQLIAQCVLCVSVCVDGTRWERGGGCEACCLPAVRGFKSPSPPLIGSSKRCIVLRHDGGSPAICCSPLHHQQQRFIHSHHRAPRGRRWIGRWWGAGSGSCEKHRR